MKANNGDLVLVISTEPNLSLNGYRLIGKILPVKKVVLNWQNVGHIALVEDYMAGAAAWLTESNLEIVYTGE